MLKFRLVTVIAAVAFALWAPIAQSVPIVFNALLSGPAESPPNASPGTGFAQVIFDFDAHTMRVIASFADLIGTTTAAHIHCCVTTPGGTAGVATQTPSFAGFPLGVSAGTMDQTFDMTLASSYRAGFVTDSGGVPQAELRLLEGLQAGTAYFNIHTTSFPGGEIRGFLQVPEPASTLLLGAALLALALAGRRFRSRVHR